MANNDRPYLPGGSQDLIWGTKGPAPDGYGAITDANRDAVLAAQKEMNTVPGCPVGVTPNMQCELVAWPERQRSSPDAWKAKPGRF